VGSRVFIAVRPERMRIARAAAEATPGDNRLVGTVKDIAYFGDFFMYHVDVGAGLTLRVSQPVLTRLRERPVDWEDRVAVEWDAPATVVLPE
jgi:putrescine transport system ATP-binding protein